MLYCKKHLFCLLISASAFAGKEQTQSAVSDNQEKTKAAVSLSQTHTESTVSAFYDLAALQNIVQTDKDLSTHGFIPPFAAMVLYLARPDLVYILRKMMDNPENQDYIARMLATLRDYEIFNFSTICQYNNPNPEESTKAKKMLKHCFDELVKMLKTSPNIDEIMKKFNKLHISTLSFSDKNIKLNISLMLGLIYLTKTHIDNPNYRHIHIKSILQLIDNHSIFPPRGDYIDDFYRTLNLNIYHLQTPFGIITLDLSSI
jgi:hypothetical protein